jgi:hypothetical protein
MADELDVKIESGNAPNSALRLGHNSCVKRSYMAHGVFRSRFGYGKEVSAVAAAIAVEIYIAARGIQAEALAETCTSSYAVQQILQARRHVTIVRARYTTSARFGCRATQEPLLRQYRENPVDHGPEIGVELQFLWNGDLLHARRYRIGHLALARATVSRRRHEAEGWTNEP